MNRKRKKQAEKYVSCKNNLTKNDDLLRLHSARSHGIEF